MTPKVRSTKGIMFVSVLGALGNALSGISIMVSPIIPSVPLGPINFSLAIDLSHLTTFIAALFGGSAVGGLTGLIGGFVAAYEFGFSKGNLITGFGLPIGKALTGITAGLIMRKFISSNRRRLLVIPATIASYLPEAAYTAFLFIALFPTLFGLPLWLVNLITVQILLKAFSEMLIMGLILVALLGNRGFVGYVNKFLTY
jgi:hypothetical protein